jgi:UDP-2-acetamido-3-amino-2,3-dideoxy-glucuronate N-acetyltransferase
MIHKKAHALADCDVPASCKVWQFASVVRGAKLGEDCTVASCAIVDGATLGDRCLIGHGASVHPGARVGNDVFIGPGAVICNDAWPRAHKRGFDASVTSVIIEDGASIGANAVVIAGVRIGAGAMVAAGFVAARDVPARFLLGPNGLHPITDEEARCEARNGKTGRAR